MSAWTTPKTWAFEEELSSADMNTYVRDNSNALPRVTHYRNALLGGGPGSPGDIRVFVGTEVITFDGSGNATVTLPLTVTGIVTIIVNNGDGNSHPDVAVATYSHTSTAFNVHATVASSGAARTGSTRVNYVVYYY